MKMPATATMTRDTWTLYGQTFNSRLLIGSALYPSPAIMRDAITESGAEIVTVSASLQSRVVANHSGASSKS